MKKFSFLTLAFVTCFGAAMAQNTDDDKAHKPMRTAMAVQPRFGIKGGVNIANLEMDDEVTTTEFKTNTKTSFQFGFFANIPLGGAIRLQPELVYSGQGAKVTNTATGAPANSGYEIDLGYLDVPIMFQWQSPTGLNFELGPQVGFLVNGEQDFDNPATANYDIKDDMKKINFSVGVGAGYLTRIGLGFGVRYNHGISNVYNSDDAPAAQKGLEFSTRNIGITLNYHFGAAK